MKTAVKTSVVTVLIVLIHLGTCTIPDYIHVCQHDDTDLGGCIKNSIEALRPRLITGIPEINVPSIEPLNLERLSISTNSGENHLSTNITNPQIWGASNFKLLKIRPKLTDNKASFQFEVVVPQLGIEGDYEIDTKLLSLEVKGKGPFRANLTDYHFVCLLKGQKVQRDRVKHLKFDQMKCDCRIEKITIKLENLFEGNPLLGKATNDIINDNSDTFYQEIKPSLLKSLEQKFLDISNKITLSFTHEELFP